MEKVEKVIFIGDVNPVKFLGVNDANLNFLKSRTSTQIIVRGDELRLRGNPEEVELISKVIYILKNEIKKRGEMEDGEVKEMMKWGLEHGAEEMGDTKDFIITPKKRIELKTPNQKEYIKLIDENDVVIAIGPAGTGKTYLAVASAINFLRKNLVERVILTRPAVEAGESLGFLPGDFQEKINPYLTPLYDALYALLTPETIKRYIDTRVIEIAPLAYMRGRTFSDAFVILDEAQNSKAVQMKMFLTRLGPRSKLVLTGDITQIDLPGNEASGLVEIQSVLKGVKGIAFIYFTAEDVVRHGLVKDIVNAYERFERKNHHSAQEKKEV
ncbi:MAG TPA: PhoH family protein [Candidatus Hydrothermia bacterium]|nr:PhoH family protein [Candidatus Hydrothermia bacterium]